MSLTSAMLTARSAIQARSAEIAITSRNISNVNNASYTRVEANTQNIATRNGSVVYVNHATRVANKAALSAVLRSGSQATASGSYASMLDQVNPSADKPFGSDISKSIGDLKEKLTAFGNDPSNVVLGQSVTNSASGLVDQLKQASSSVSKARMDADAAMGRAADNIRNILKDMEGVNAKIVSGTAAGNDVNDLIDQRNDMLKVLSQEVGIDVVEQENKQDCC